MESEKTYEQDGDQAFDDLKNPPTDFGAYLDRFARFAGDAVNGLLPQGEIQETNRYLYAPFLRYSENDGKRHRPLICFAACMAVGGDARNALRAAAAIEHFHTAALIHDDIEDEADMRRGQPCLHKTEGLAAAINIGDFGLSFAQGVVLDDPLLSDVVKLRVAKELWAMVSWTIEGQSLDIGWARDNRFDISEDDYLYMARHKTANYSAAVPLAVGAIVGGGTEAQVEALRSFGLKAGLAFQIQDDLLNLVGTEESTKKDFRSDITEGKRTLMAVHALQHSTEANRAELLRILSSHETDPAVCASAVAIMQESASIRYAKEYAERLVEEAKTQLAEALEPSAARDVLLSMADWFVRRLG